MSGDQERCTVLHGTMVFASVHLYSVAQCAVIVSMDDSSKTLYTDDCFI